MLVDFIQIPNETLHKLDMEEKKKDGNAKKSSKFLVPFSPNTPRPARDTTSSVFLTPPYSAECQGGSVEKAIKIPCFPRDSVKIPFELSFEVEELDRDYKFDILRALRDSDLIQTVVKKILEHLDDLSLFRASHVSRTWHGVIRGKEGVEKKRITNFISRKRQYCEDKGKENIGIQKRSRDFAQSILENTPKSAAKVFKPETDSKFTTRYRPCPKCNSPARLNETESATCENCHENFCLLCFKKFDGHKSEDCTGAISPLPIRTKRTRNRSNMIGSKQSKNRLRRLSHQKK